MDIQSNVPEQDIFLSNFAKLAQETSFTLPLTIAAGGAMVSGHLIGLYEWLELFARQAGDVGTAAEQKSKAAFEEEKASGSLVYDFLHLRNAKIVSGNSLVPSPGDGFLWRVRISEVTGWSVAYLQVL